AERTVAQVIPAEVLLPVPVGLDLIDQHGPLLAAVPAGVALAVAVDVEPPDHRRAVHRVLPYASVDGLALPGHVLRQADVHRQQHGGNHSAILSWMAALHASNLIRVYTWLDCNPPNDSIWLGGGGDGHRTGRGFPAGSAQQHAGRRRGADR